MCVHPLEKAMSSGVEPFRNVRSEVAERARTALTVAMPEIKSCGASAQLGEPVAGVDHLVDVGYPAGVFPREAKTRVASELARAIADAGGVARVAFVARVVEDCA